MNKGLLACLSVACLAWPVSSFAADATCTVSTNGVACKVPAPVTKSFTLDLGTIQGPPTFAIKHKPNSGAEAPWGKCQKGATGATYTCTADAGSPSTVTDGSFIPTPAAGEKLTAPDGTELALRLSIEGGAGGSGNGSAGGADDDGLPFLPMSVWQASLRELGQELRGHDLGQYYDRGRDVAVLFFDADATPYFPLPDVIDEDDDIYVAVVDTKARLTDARISLSGCNRPPVEPRIYGNYTETLKLLREGAEKAPQAPELAVVFRAFGKCAGAAAGGPQLSIRRANGDQHTATIAVNPLYRFALGVAVAYDTTEQRSFDARTAAGDTVPRIAESKDQLGLSSLLYVSMYLWARDFRKKNLLEPQRLQVFLGLDPRDFTRYLVVGGGYELTQGLNLLVGWRALSQQPVLAEGSGLRVGSSYDGPRDQIPTRNRWETGGLFVGLGLSTDLIGRFR